MKTIAIDIRHIYGKKTGKGWYVHHLLKEILKKDKTNQYILYSKIDKPPFPLPKNVILKTLKAPSLLWHFSVIHNLKKQRVDVFWAPTSYIIPAYAPKNIRTIITIHDLVALMFPENHNKKAIFIERKTLKKAAKKAKYIFAVSNSTSKDIKKMFDIEKKKIIVTHCSADQDFRVIPLKESKKVIKELGINKKFILAVGTLEPRKNLIRLIRAFNNLSRNNFSTHLVIVGGKGWQYKDIYKESLQNKRINFLGYVKRSELVALYNQAEIFVFPSLYEGFGIPPLEAMQCGCPVITSDTSSLPEVVGKAAITVNPKNIREITGAIEKLLENEELHSELLRSGLYQSKKFSWSASAEIILKVFNSK